MQMKNTNKYFHRIIGKPTPDIDTTKDTNISDGAYRLYLYLLGLNNCVRYDDDYLAEVLNTSRRVIANRRKELIEADLFITQQIAPRLFFSFIGYAGMPASKVKETLNGWNLV